MSHGPVAPTAPARTLADARSLLFVPADRPERFAKALASGADAVIFDLEDAVAPAAKPQARDGLAQAWRTLAAPGGPRRVLRINGAATHEHADDLALARALQAQGLDAVMLAKAESAAQIEAVAQACPGLAVLPLIESADGLLDAQAMAQVPQVVRLAFGHIDFQADLGMACAPDEAELLPARWALVLASRAARRAPPIDGVTVALHDAELLGRDAARARRLGFGGKLCIHPAQVLGVHRALAPSPAECDWARRVLAAVEAAGDGVGAGALRLDGRMVDAPVVALARRHLACEFHEPGA